jgi:hypothetical protein
MDLALDPTRANNPILCPPAAHAKVTDSRPLVPSGPEAHIAPTTSDDVKPFDEDWDDLGGIFNDGGAVTISGKTKVNGNTAAPLGAGS